ncbi:hypothetical protein Taro_011674, partial [Colocasia esculenta]|nr:hypothetical protein [Colocasia esculenta]
ATSVDTSWASVDTLSQITQKVFWKLSLVSTLPDPMSTLLDHSVDTLSQHSPEGVLGRSLVSTLPDLVSTLPDQFCPKGDYEVQEEEQVEDGNASE